jgi:hypothetical protein
MYIPLVALLKFLQNNKNKTETGNEIQSERNRSQMAKILGI